MKVSKNVLPMSFLLVIVAFLAGYILSGQRAGTEIRTALEREIDAVVTLRDQLETSAGKISQLENEKAELGEQLTESKLKIEQLEGEIYGITASSPVVKRKRRVSRRENLRVVDSASVSVPGRKAEPERVEYTLEPERASVITGETEEGTEPSGPGAGQEEREEEYKSLQIGKGQSLSFASPAFPRLVETDWLEDNMTKQNIRILFVDNWPSDKETYERGHIPGSVFMGVGAQMGTLGDGSAAPDKQSFEGMMLRLGVNNGDHVVLYGAEGKSVFTLGAFWLMDYFGHKKLSYLHGGLAKWNREKRPVEGGMKAGVAGKYSASKADESIRVDADYVLGRLNNSRAVLVDVRGSGEYNGKENIEKNRRTGHIPGAMNLSYEVTNFNADGTIRAKEQLKALYESAGVTKDKEVIVYCQGGVRAANTYFILKHILRYPTVRNYVGSWGEWGNRVDFNRYPAEGMSR